MKRILKITLKILGSFLLFLVIWGLTITTTKNIHKVILVEEFKSRATYQEDISDDYVKYYRIESNETKKAFTTDGSFVYPGTRYDILVSCQASLFNPLVSGVVSFFAGGHAAFVNSTYRDFQNDSITADITSIEATGLSAGDNVAQLFSNDYWGIVDPFTEVIGLRVKMTESQRREVQSICASYLGDPYNYSFIFNTVNSSYCSDIISKSFREIGINLNKDGFATTIYDLICSGDCYISYYHVIKDDVKYIYYLD